MNFTFETIYLNFTSLTTMFHYVKLKLNKHLGKLDKFNKILDVQNVFILNLIVTFRDIFILSAKKKVTKINAASHKFFPYFLYSVWPLCIIKIGLLVVWQKFLIGMRQSSIFQSSLLKVFWTWGRDVVSENVNTQVHVYLYTLRDVNTQVHVYLYYKRF